MTLDVEALAVLDRDETEPAVSVGLAVDRVRSGEPLDRLIPFGVVDEDGTVGLVDDHDPAALGSWVGLRGFVTRLRGASGLAVVRNRALPGVDVDGFGHGQGSSRSRI